MLLSEFPISLIRLYSFPGMGASAFGKMCAPAGPRAPRPAKAGPAALRAAAGLRPAVGRGGGPVAILPKTCYNTPGKQVVAVQYEAVEQARFLSRPNRFIAQVELSGRVETVHVKNTGRCRELLVPGATVYLAPGHSPNRKTRYDLIAVEKGPLLINMDSQAPNAVAREALPRLLPQLSLLRPETVFGTSRFDFYAEASLHHWFIEVKGVTLEENGVARFPDAPTARGARHLRELCRAVDQGYRALALFVIQMKGVVRFEPNARTDPGFAQALEEAAAHGVQLLAVDCRVAPDTLQADAPVPIWLGGRPLPPFCP